MYFAIDLNNFKIGLLDISFYSVAIARHLRHHVFIVSHNLVDEVSIFVKVNITIGKKSQTTFCMCYYIYG